MAEIIANGRALKATIKFNIEKGARPEGTIRLCAVGGGHVDLVLSLYEMLEIYSKCAANPYFEYGKGGGKSARPEDITKSGREALKKAKEEIERFAKDFGL